MKAPDSLNITRQRALLAAWVVSILLVAGAMWRGVKPLLEADFSTPPSDKLGVDFSDAVYYPVRELLAGGNPYLPQNMFDRWGTKQEFDLYAPLHLLLHLPLGLMSFSTAWIVYSLVGAASFLAGGAIASRLLPGRHVALMATFVAGLALAIQPARLVLYFGNVNSLIWLGAAAALVCMHRSPRSWCGALGLALACIKPQYGIPLAVLMSARGAWPTVWRGVLLAAVGSLPVALVLLAREGSPAQLAHVISENLAYAQSTPYGQRDSLVRIDLSAQVARLTGWSPPGAEFVWTAVSLAVVGFLVRGRRQSHPQDLLLITLTVMTCLVHSVGELELPLVGVVAVAAVAWRSRRLDPALALASALLFALWVQDTAMKNLIAERFGPSAPNALEGAIVLSCLLLALAARLLPLPQWRLPVSASSQLRPAGVQEPRGDVRRPRPAPTQPSGQNAPE